MNICYVTQEYPRGNEFGGIATYIHQMAKAMAEMGHKVIIVTRGHDKQTHYTEMNGIEVFSLLPHLFHSRRILRRLDLLGLGYAIALMRVLPDIITQHKIHIIETQSTPADIILYHLFRRVKDVPTIIRFHTNLPWYWNFLFKKSNFLSLSVYHKQRSITERIMAHRANSITVPSVAAVNLFNQRFKGLEHKVKLLPNFVDAGLFQPVLSQANNHKCRILCLGRSDPIKGFEVLYQAMPEILKAVPSAEIIFAGMSNYDELHKYAIQVNAPVPENLKSKIRFAGIVPYQEMPKLYNQATICVIPSRWEQFAFVCLEAMACGKAIVASDVGGLSEMIENEESGILVKAGDVGALAKAVIRVLRNEEKRKYLESKARQRVVDLYTKAQIISATIQHYQSVLSELKN